ncbi:MAG TPA: endolytic transglycosylase MltG [Gemmatimonadales bacterium]
MRRLFPALLLLAACDGVPAGDGTTERIIVPPGASFGQVLDSLDAHGLVGNRFLLKVRAKLTGRDRAVLAGVYQIPRGSSHAALLDLLQEGRQEEVRLTIPEGLTIGEVADLVEERLGIPADSLAAAATDSLLADSLGIRARSLEGYLRPDTYQLPPDITARELVRRLALEFETRWKPEWTARLDTLGLTRGELLALASIVEGEARVDAEREVIAGVYHNRLRIGMALQADPTVQYAIMLRTGERKKRLFEKDYGFASPYNTYLNPGLPPGPVNSPSERSIEAALYPDSVPYLFFVAQPDGRHVFTRTYREHLRAVGEARRARDASARSTP